MRKLRERLSFANVMSVIAVCIALGGTAYAANKISGKTIKNSTIAKKKLKANVLKGLDTCPSGATNYTQGICYSGQNGGADWDIAARDCATKGLRLPDLGEGLLITNKTVSAVSVDDGRLGHGSAQHPGDRAHRRRRLHPDRDEPARGALSRTSAS